MAFSYKEYTTRDSGQREFTFAFDAIAKDTTNIKVTIGGKHLYDGVTEYNTTTRLPGSGSKPDAEYTVSSGSITIKNSVTFTVGSTTVTSGVPTLSNDVPLRIYRETNRSSAEVTFSSGSILSDTDLNKANNHARFLALEAVDRSDESMAIDGNDSTQYDIQISGVDKRIFGVKDPTNTNDAANKAYVDSARMEWNWKGYWVAGTTYALRDLITQSDTGAVYVCTTAHIASSSFNDDLGNWATVIDAGDWNVKLTEDLTINSGQTYITPYKIDLNGNTLTNNGTLICAEIITGDGTYTGGASSSLTTSGPINISSASLVSPSGIQELTNKTLTSPKINEDVALTATATELNLLNGVSGLVQADFTKLAAIDATASEINTVADGSTSPGTEAVAGTDGIVTNDAGTMRQTTVDTFDTYLSQTSKTLTNKKIPEIDSDAAITLDATTYVELNADNGIVYMKDGATTMLTIQLSGGNTTITGP